MCGMCTNGCSRNLSVNSVGDKNEVIKCMFFNALANPLKRVPTYQILWGTYIIQKITVALAAADGRPIPRLATDMFYLCADSGQQSAVSGAVAAADGGAVCRAAAAEAPADSVPAADGGHRRGVLSAVPPAADGCR